MNTRINFITSANDAIDNFNSLTLYQLPQISINYHPPPITNKYIEALAISVTLSSAFSSYNIDKPF